MQSSILDMLNGIEKEEKEKAARVRLGAHMNSSGSGSHSNSSGSAVSKRPLQHSISSYFHSKSHLHSASSSSSSSSSKTSNSKSTSSDSQVERSSWACGVCTFYMEDPTSSACDMCGTSRPFKSQSPPSPSSSSSSSSSSLSLNKKRQRIIMDDESDEDIDNDIDNDKDLLYARELQEAEILNRKYSCGICLDNDVKLEDMVSLSCQPVAHKYCRECFIDYCSDKINESITEIYCPEVKCNCEITFWELEGNLPENIMKKYERFSLRNACEKNGYIHCPSCNEWFADVNLADTPQAEAIWKNVVCGKCKHEFCGKCGEKPHKGISSKVDITCADLAKELSKANEALLQLAGQEGYKKCPHCGALAELVEDCCKFVYCRCGKKFCFLCEVELSDKDHYSHFRGKPGCVGPFGPVCVNTSTGEATQYKLRRSTKENTVNYNE